LALAQRLAAAALALAGASWAHADTEQSVDAGGVARTFVLHVPPGIDSRASLPLVVVFHGGGGNGVNASRMSAMDDKADLARFVVAYPNGSGRMGGSLLTWNTWQCCGFALDHRVDDVAFVRAMVESISRQYRIDPKRIYATGMSNGAMMAYRVGCELSDVFAAIAPVAGALDTDDCRPGHPVSVVAFHGTADRHIRYEGGTPAVSFDRGHARDDKSVAYAVGFWARHDGCKASPKVTRSGHVVHEAFECAGSAAVELYTIEGQGHAWPGGGKGLRAGNVDAPTQEISATNVMWDFFARHPKP